MLPLQRDRGSASAGLPAVEYDIGMTTSRRRGLWAAVIVIVVLVAAAVLALTRGGDNQPSRAAEPAGPAASLSPKASETPPAETPVSAAPLTAAPSGVQWELFQDVALPTSRTDGPKRVDGPVHAGFARTPTGALLADAQIQYRSLITPDLDDLRTIGEQQVVAGPGRTAYLNLVGQLANNEPPANGYTQIVGFRYVTFSPDLAVITVATQGKSGKIQVGTDTLRWIKGDWRLELPATGLQQPQVVQDLSGFVPWSGVS